jgi:hypothetical protein
MKLTEFNMKPSLVAKTALKENFNQYFNVDNLGPFETKKMLTKVRGLINEAKSKQSGVGTETNAAYLKLVFMEQALNHHYGELRSMPMYNQRVIVENEEVEKSQVVLAAQEMVDAMQKMVEDVSDMLVKELPAVVDGVNSEFGTSEGEQFSSQVSEALTSLQQALTQAKTGIQGALGTITGQGGGGFGDEMGGEMPAMGDEMGGEMPAMGDEMDGGEGPELPEEPEEEPESPIGRAKR